MKNWVKSSAKIGNDHGKENGISEVSAGTENHQHVMSVAFDSIWEFVDNAFENTQHEEKCSFM